ncbi:MAG: hypothetical protein K8U03_14575 [Planctomycetia bacterium]|nr:hypothetical protein [Planctomycetia bacterium]
MIVVATKLRLAAAPQMQWVPIHPLPPRPPPSLFTARPEFMQPRNGEVVETPQAVAPKRMTRWARFWKRVTAIRGSWVALSPQRILICDLLHFARKLPTIPVQRRINLAAVRDAREAAKRRPGWCAIFTKAFALTAAERPELRRAYIQCPWPLLYQSNVSVASVAVEQQQGSESCVAFAKLHRPDERSLHALDRHLKMFSRSSRRNSLIARTGLLVARLWWPLRYCMWWFALNGVGKFRTRHFGTFGVSVYSGLGAESLHPLCPLTYLVSYGVMQPNGDIDVRLVYDHRVVDGAVVARALAAMETVLNGAILRELQTLQPRESLATEENSAGEPAIVLPLHVAEGSVGRRARR